MRKLEVANVMWDNFTVVGILDKSKQNVFLNSSIMALRVAYEGQLDILAQHTGDYWSIKVREYRKDGDKLVYGPTLIYMEKVRYHEEKVRLEFNPTQQTEKSDEVKNYFLDVLEDKSVSRADLAFDVYGDLSGYRLNRAGVSSNYYMGRSGRLETLYYGSRGSDKQIRMYNKLKELSAHKKFHELAELPQLPSDWWRLELQMRRDENANFVELGNEVLDQLYRVHDLDRNAITGQDYVILIAITEHPELLGELSKYHRKKYRKMLREVQKSTLAENLSELLKSEESRLTAELEKMTAEFEKS